MGTLNIAIDARLDPGMAGGVESVILGLAHGLSRLEPGDEAYHFLTFAGPQPWLEPHLSGACRLLQGSQAPKRPTALKAFERALRHRIRAWFPSKEQAVVKVPRSDGTIEAAGMDLVHFPLQSAFITAVPSLYHPHDLQHVHLPELFTAGEIHRRDTLYRTFCGQASLVPVASEWVQRDLEAQFGLSPAKTPVVNLAPFNAAIAPLAPGRLEALASELALPDGFVFYAAQTWPHKNHLALLEALALLRDRDGLRIPFVSSGRKGDHFPVLERRIRDLRLGDQVRFLGFVDHETLQALYARCRCVVIPSRFEAASFPLWEAFQARRAAACATTTSLPAQAAGAALLFPAEDVPALAEAIQRLWTDPGLRADLVARGAENVARFTWDRTARLFRAHYRKLAGRVLSAEDQELLAAPPLF
ncbi:MAG: glycosyltransferase family 4 protein [Holophagaceae bacterium]|nr:glycosyltransferase family 4 protein [Holophagaceae bacterium]